MSKPYDITTKDLLERQPAAWLRLVGYEVSAEIISVDADVSAVTIEADKVLLVREPRPWVAHFEFQASPDGRLPMRALRYNAVIEYRLNLPVLTVLVLLRREADLALLTGEFRRELPDGTCYDLFRYRVVRIWQEPVERFLAGDLATLPLAPIADVRAEQLPQIVERMKARIAAETTNEEARSLWTATYLLMGLRYTATTISKLLQGVIAMKESSTYQAILVEGRAEGRANEARAMLLRIGRKRFGDPDPAVRHFIDAVSDVEQLEQLAERIIDVQSWQELVDDSSAP